MSDTSRYSLDDLLYLMQRLRDPDTGCAWDLQQNYQSIAKYTLEECYELIDALEADDVDAIRGELGDVLFQVIFYARLGEESGSFDFQEVVHGITAKLVRRHPHVFPGGDLRGIGGGGSEPPEIKQRWEKIKAAERLSAGMVSVVDDVPLALPALTRAAKLQKRSRNIGLDWAAPGAVLEALQAEIEELQSALQTGDRDAIAHEAGDVLFTAVNVCRHLDTDAEQVLRSANRRFEQRVRKVEELLADTDIQGVQADEALLDSLWQKAKQKIAEQAN